MVAPELSLLSSLRFSRGDANFRTCLSAAVESVESNEHGTGQCKGELCLGHGHRASSGQHVSLMVIIQFDAQFY